MPDWIVHISIALLLAVILKIKNWKLMITGAVLPDIPRILLIISNYLNFNELNSFLILEPLHSPFLNIFESMAIALLFANFFQNFLLVYLGVITHYVLDYFQFAGKFGHLLLYPFSYEQFSLNLFYGGSLILLVLGLIVTIMSLYLLKEKKDIVILSKIKLLEKNNLDNKDKIVIKLIRAQLKNDWRTPLINFLNKLIMKYKK